MRIPSIFLRTCRRSGKLERSVAVAKLRDDAQEFGEVKRVVNAVLQSVDARAPLG